MLRGWIRRGWNDETAAVAPTVALSLFALIAAGGLAFDYARMVSLDTELQNAADQAALAAATQLDGESGAIVRATNAASSAGALAANQTRFANDGGSIAVTINNAPVFCSSFDDSVEDAAAACTAATGDADARVAWVSVVPREAFYALTPVIDLFRSGQMSAEAVAGVKSAMCKIPPIMLCNPQEPAGNEDEAYDFSIAAGIGLKLIAGNATVPGNFGWLESNVSGGAAGLAAALGYNDPPGECLPTTGVTTKTGMTSSVLSALNTRFDVYANGNSTCPSQYGGDCSPSRNSRKDLVCEGKGAGGSGGCKNDKWTVSARPYRPTTVAALPSDGTKDPDIMGYPRDLCHAVTASSQTCGVTGTGTWDRDAYFRVNYGWTTQAAWTGATGLPATATRYEVYQWEMDHPSIAVGATVRGIDIPQVSSDSKYYAYGKPATGRAGITPDEDTVDRRRISIAVLNCQAINLHGKTSDIPVPKWLDLFLVEPSLDRGSGFSDQKEVYAETIEVTPAGNNGETLGQVVRRDLPYLIR